MALAPSAYDVDKLPPLATKIIYTDESEYSSRGGADVVGNGFHHAVTTSLLAILELSAAGGRDVSMNFAVKDHQRIVRVPLTERAFTSASRYDFGSWTTEAANETMAPDYLLSDATYTSLAVIAAHAYVREGVPLTVGYPGNYQHRNLYEWFGASYPTACAGPHFDIYRVLREAEAILAASLGTTPASLEDDMSLTNLFVPFKKKDGQPVAANKTAWLHINDKAHISVLAAPTEHVQGNVKLNVTGGDPYKSSFKITGYVNNVAGDKIVSSVSLGAVEYPFTPDGTFVEYTVNCGLAANQRLAFKIGDSAHPFTVESAVFRGWKKD